jgi:hypothetical protein
MCVTCSLGDETGHEHVILNEKPLRKRLYGITKSKLKIVVVGG